MRNLLLGLVVGAACGLAIERFVVSDESARSSRADRGDAAPAGTGAVVKEPAAAAPDVAGLLARIAELEARLREGGGALEFPGIPVPTTDEGIALLIEEFDRTDDLDRLLVAIRALLMQGERGYPKLAQLLMRVVKKGMDGKIDDESEILPRIVPAMRIAMEQEKQLVGFVSYLMRTPTAPAPLKVGAMFGAAFLSLNRVPGSEQFAPMLLDQLSAGALGSGDSAEMLIMAMGILGKKEAVDPLLAILNDPQKKGLHDNAMNALSMIGDDRALPIVQARLRDPQNQWPWTEMRALGRIDTDEARAVAEDYLGRMKDADNFFSMAGHYLSASRNEKVVEMVIQRARADPGNNWWSAVYALGRVRTPAADAALAEYARDSSNPQRQQQAQGILDRRREAEEQMAALEPAEPPR